jgi:hypothetical protein
MRAPKWAVGMQRLQVGVYLDARNQIHLDHKAICRELKMAYTKENALKIERAFAGLMLKKTANPAAAVVRVIQVVDPPEER